MRFGLVVFIAASAFSGAATAAVEEKCAAQYSLEEQTILEWAALGGDPHAQFAIAQCAFPAGRGDLSDAEKLYAMKWITLALCEAGGAKDSAEQDRLTRKLKSQSDISFRRFGGITDDETWTSREKQLIYYRRDQAAKLRARFDELQPVMSEALKAEARNALADQLARVGGIGYLRLADLTSCKEFAAGEPVAAAAYAAAAEAWAQSPERTAYGASRSAGYSVAEEAERRYATLSVSGKRAADMVKARLLKTTPETVAALEDRAALGRLSDLATLHLAGTPGGPSLTLAAQYALEALGFMQFVNGPDNDYGPSTIEAVKRAQAHYGRPETRWLSGEEARRLLCDAATKKSDPISYYHLTVMFTQGWGFSQDLDRAGFAVARAESLLAARLAAPEALPEWKRRHYPGFRQLIQRAKGAIDGAKEAFPSRGMRITEENLCE